MSYASRPLGSHLRQQSMGGSLGSSSGQSPVLQARINEKRAELENLKQLRDLSAGLAGQMQMLEEKLSTLSDGTEAVATVLGNWHNVLYLKRWSEYPQSMRQCYNHPKMKNRMNEEDALSRWETRRGYTCIHDEFGALNGATGRYWVVSSDAKNGLVMDRVHVGMAGKKQLDF